MRMGLGRKPRVSEPQVHLQLFCLVYLFFFRQMSHCVPPTDPQPFLHALLFLLSWLGISDGDLSFMESSLYLMDAPSGLRQGSSATSGVCGGCWDLFSFWGLCPHSLELFELAIFSDFSLFLASHSLCSWLRKQIYSVDQTRRNR